MSLRERLKSGVALEVIVTINSERFLVRGITRSKRSEIFAAHNKNGKIDSHKLEGVLLSTCVFDPETQQPVFSVEEWKEWDSVASGITGPLFAEVMRVNGIDNDDVGREVKNSEATDS